ncbi:MAG: hypothetical protein P4L98_22940, partial [Ancalomicrobiaceae bacterium]|nr:hypothetical protein [Ancalomicrobiaceae bacterium]
MRRATPLSTLALLFVLAVPGAAAAQEAMQVKCPEDAVPLPAELSGWTTQLPIVAATQPGQIGSAEVKVG